MDTKDIEKSDTETGGSKKSEATLVKKEPVVSLDQYGEYLEAFRKDIDKLKKESRSLSQINKEVETLKKRADDVERDFSSLERRIDRTNIFMQWMTGIIVGVFFVTGILIVIDYAKNRGDGYEHFINQVNSLKQDYYSKDDVNNLLTSFKNCIWFNGLFHCIK